MATNLVSGNANQAVANDDFEAYQREANKADLEAKFGRTREAEPAPPAPEKDADAAKPAKESATEASPERKRRPGFGDLRRENSDLKAEIERLKAGKREPSPEPEAEPEAKAPEKLRARPKADEKVDGKPKYETWEAYEDDLLAWNTEKVLRTIDERDAKKTQEAKVEAVNKTIEQSWKTRVDKAREAHADYDEVALGEDGPGKLIGPGSIVDEWLMQSEHGAELLYYFGQHPDELKKFEKVDSPAAARRALVKLEDTLSAPPKESKPEPEPETRVTKAPKPTSEVGGRGTHLPDPIRAAIADGSDAATARYIEEQNRRDIRAKFGDRR
jgi:hypothetical protein